MGPHSIRPARQWRKAAAWLLVLVVGVCGGRPGQAEPVLETSDQKPPDVLSLEGAVAWALLHNPEIAALREQHGIAAAGIVVAHTYPFNPTLYNRTSVDKGLPDEEINRFPFQVGLFLQLELFGQGKYRQQAAAATLSRTDWEIAFQEVALAVRVARAFQTVIYRQEKVRLVEANIQLNQKVVEQVRKLVEQGKLRRPDLLLAQTEVEANRATLYPARTALLTALADLYRGLGVTCQGVGLQGALDGLVVPVDCKALTDQALQMRADLRARQMVVNETEARYRLQVADRFGNPTIGPFYENDNTATNYYAVQMNVPIPVFNLRHGEIEQRLAEKQRAILDVHTVEVQIEQDVQAATIRLANAREGVTTYQNDILPSLRAALDGMQKLFQQGEADILRITDLERKLLQAQSGYLDALWEVSQAQADLAAAVGDPGIVTCPQRH